MWPTWPEEFVDLRMSQLLLYDYPELPAEKEMQRDTLLRARALWEGWAKVPTATRAAFASWLFAAPPGFVPSLSLSLRRKTNGRAIDVVCGARGLRISAWGARRGLVNLGTLQRHGDVHDADDPPHRVLLICGLRAFLEGHGVDSRSVAAVRSFFEREAEGLGADGVSSVVASVEVRDSSPAELAVATRVLGIADAAGVATRPAYVADLRLALCPLFGAITNPNANDERKAAGSDDADGSGVLAGLGSPDGNAAAALGLELSAQTLLEFSPLPRTNPDPDHLTPNPNSNPDPKPNADLPRPPKPKRKPKPLSRIPDPRDPNPNKRSVLFFSADAVLSCNAGEGLDLDEQAGAGGMLAHLDAALGLGLGFGLESAVEPRGHVTGLAV